MVDSVNIFLDSLKFQFCYFFERFYGFRQQIVFFWVVFSKIVCVFYQNTSKLMFFSHFRKMKTRTYIRRRSRRSSSCWVQVPCKPLSFCAFFRLKVASFLQCLFFKG